MYVIPYAFVFLGLSCLVSSEAVFCWIYIQRDFFNVFGHVCLPHQAAE